MDTPAPEDLHLNSTLSTRNESLPKFSAKKMLINKPLMIFVCCFVFLVIGAWSFMNKDLFFHKKTQPLQQYYLSDDQNKWSIPVPATDVNDVSTYLSPPLSDGTRPIKGYVYKGDRVWAYKCVNGVCGADYTLSLTESFNLIKEPLDGIKWSPSPPADNIDAILQYVAPPLSDGSIPLKGYIFKGSQYWAYTCVAGNCTRNFTSTLSAYFDSIKEADLSSIKWTVAPPSGGIDAISQYVASPYQASVTTIKGYVYKGNRVWAYHCSSGQCLRDFTQTLDVSFSGIEEANPLDPKWNPAVPTDRVDAVTQFFDIDGYTLKGYIYKGDRVWAYACDTRLTQHSCKTGYTWTLGYAWTKPAPIDPQYVVMNKYVGIGVRNDSNGQLGCLRWNTNYCNIWDPRYILDQANPAYHWTDASIKEIVDGAGGIAGIGRGNTFRKPAFAYGLSYFWTPDNITEAVLRRVLDLSYNNDIPVLIKLDGTGSWGVDGWPVEIISNWWGGADLFNWWMPSVPGYSPDNWKNVEWTSWGPLTGDLSSVGKIAWRNWGTQTRIRPGPNLGSPEFLAASKRKLLRLLPIINNWYKNLPPEKKYLLVGVTLEGEVSIGLNTYYYNNGNSYICTKVPSSQCPADTDPLTQPTPLPLTPYPEPNSGINWAGTNYGSQLAQQGYAALSTKYGFGIKDTGTITKQDIDSVISKYSSIMTQTAYDMGVDFNKIIIHGTFGLPDYAIKYSGSNQLPAFTDSITNFGKPSWSFYDQPDPNAIQYATNPALADQYGLSGALQSLSHTPWGIVEGGARTPVAVNNTFNYPNLQFFTMQNWEDVYADKDSAKRDQALTAYRNALNQQPACWLSPATLSKSPNGFNVTFSWSVPVNTDTLTLLVSNIDERLPSGILKNANLINIPVTGTTSYNWTASAGGIYYWQIVASGCGGSQTRVASDYFVIGPKSCEPLTTRCSTDNKVQFCNYSGAKWVDIEACGADQVCDVASLTCLNHATGSLTANPPQCILTPGGTCSSTITWSTQYSTDPKIMVSQGGGAEVLFATGVSNPVPAPVATWITQSGVTFRLYNGTTLLSSLFVNGICQTNTNCPSNQVCLNSQCVIPTNTPIPSLTPTLTPTSTPTRTPTPTVTLTPTKTTTPSPTVTPTSTVTLAPTITLIPTGSLTPTPTLTPTPSDTPVPTPTPTSSPIPPPTVTPTPGCGAIQGDVNCDGKVNGQDYTIWLLHYNQTTTNGYKDGDFDSDGVIDGVDYVIWLINYQM